MADDYLLRNNHSDDAEYFSSWTIFSLPVMWKTLFRFDLTDLPSNSTATNTHLIQYYSSIKNFGTSDTALIHSNERWNEATVT